MSAAQSTHYGGAERRQICDGHDALMRQLTDTLVTQGQMKSDLRYIRESQERAERSAEAYRLEHLALHKETGVEQKGQADTVLDLRFKWVRATAVFAGAAAVLQGLWIAARSLGWLQ